MLQLAGNQIVELPAELGRLSHTLRLLEMSDNRLSALPDSLCALELLSSLRASENRIASLPGAIGELRRLRTLVLAANRLASLPEGLEQLEELVELDLASNALGAVPAELGRLSRLERLLLDDNQLRSVPAELGLLSSCTELGLAHNQLEELPPNLTARGMRALRWLRLHSNRLGGGTGFPPDVNVLSLHAPPSCHDNGPPVVAARAVSPRQRPLVGLLLPGLLRSYAHGAHWCRFVEAHSEVYDIRVCYCLWEVRGSPANHWAQREDKNRAERVDLAALARAYPPAHAVELVPLSAWLDTDALGNDGRYANQWAMVARCHALPRIRPRRSSRPHTASHDSPFVTTLPRCHALMEATLASEGGAAHVIRARPDLRVACLPRPLGARGEGTAYLALQVRNHHVTMQPHGNHNDDTITSRFRSGSGAQTTSSSATQPPCVPCAPGSRLGMTSTPHGWGTPQASRCSRHTLRTAAWSRPRYALPAVAASTEPSPGCKSCRGRLLRNPHGVRRVR
jgi:hypothetical protein